MSSKIILAPFAKEVMEALNRLYDIEGLPRVPNSSEFNRSPVITNWHLAPAPQMALSLTGLVAGHPRLHDGSSVLTSPLVAMADDNSWALTFNTFYRLGRPRHEEAVQ